MAATFGKIEEFQPECESIAAYLERIELFFAANEIAEGRRVPMFLSLIGSRNYSLLRNLLAPQKPSEKTYDVLKTTLQSHFQTKKIVIAERFHFHRRNQAAGETIADYVAELRRLSTHCEFGDYLEDALRDRLVCGLRNEAIQRRLLSKNELTFAKAWEVAQSMEAAERNAQQLKGADTPIQLVSRQLPKVQARNIPCSRCGGENHTAQECRFKEAICHACGKKGHISRACRSKDRMSSSRRATTHSQRWVQLEPEASGTEESGDSDSGLPVLTLGSRTGHPITVDVQANGKPLTMELDTGAAVSVISEDTQRRMFPDASLKRTTVVLRTYTGEPIRVAGHLDVKVQYGSQSCTLPLVVVAGKGPTLLGRDWLQCIQLDWKTIGLTALDEGQAKVQSLLHRYKEVFDESLGTMRHFTAKLHVRPGAKPVFCKPRTVPFALKESLGKELDRLEEQGILRRVSHSDWAAPVVPVPKADGSLRLCGDYKVTVNSSLEVDQYPLPKPDDLFSSLAGGQRFSKLDLSQAYQQMRMEEDSQHFLTLNTHQGLYQYTRLPFGIASAPAIFQRAMDTILQGIPHTVCYIDDILVTGDTEEEHLRNLEEVLRRLQHYGIRVKRRKCSFLQESVEYLGHRIDGEGLHTTPRKVEAVQLAPTPRNQKQLRSFLGLLQYYGKFIPNMSTTLNPLNALLRKDTKWKWSAEAEKAFKQAKELLTSATVLAHYNPGLPLRLAADASAYGIGAVISHVCEDGTERPVAYASRTLTESEKNYAQLEKEALSLVFGVRKFHQYLYGRPFTLYTDHQPLTTIFGPKRGVPPLAAARMQCWALILSAYDYQIQFKPTKAHANADGLSRLPVSSASMPSPPSQDNRLPDSDVFSIRQIEALPMTHIQLRAATRRDPLLSRVLLYTQRGWPLDVPESMKPYYHRRDELSLENQCVLWGIRVIVPKRLQNQVLEELHRSHVGIARMKALARSYVWWPKLDEDIECLIKSCQRCQAVKNAPPVAPLHPWVWPAKPWQRVHVDYAGPFMGRQFLIVVDAHSKWPEVIEMKTTTSSATILELRRLFSSYGLPEQLVSDNGPQFTSTEFEKFLKSNGIKHTCSAPYHPSSNGLAERFVQTFKRAMKASEHPELSFHQQLMGFLLSYRTIPHATTQVAPASLFLQRHVRTRFDLLRPEVEDIVSSSQSAQKQNFDKHCRQRDFFVGQRVMVRNLRPGPRWVPGTLIERKGPLTYLVQVSEGRIWKRHVDHLHETTDTPQDHTSFVVPTAESDSAEIEQPELSNFPLDAGTSSSPELTTESESDPAANIPTMEACEVPPVIPPTTAMPTSSPVRRYPQRMRKPPDRYHS